MCFTKVAIIEPVGGHGGMDYYDLGLCSGLANAGSQVTLHSCNMTSFPSSINFQFRSDYKDIFGTSPAWKRLLRYLKGTVSVVRQAVINKVYLCHFHFFAVGPLEAFNVSICKIAGRCVIVTVHDVESFATVTKLPLIQRITYSQVTRFIVHNQISQMELIRVAGISADRISIIPHGNYIPMLKNITSTQDSRQRLGIPENSKVLLFFGQIKEAKGLDLLLEALPSVLKSHPNTVLIIAGRPWKTDFTTYETQIRELGIHDSCICHIRYIPDEEVPLFYGSADMIVLPYRKIYQSGVILMAMSYGVPVLASDLPGMKEIIVDGETGFLFKSGDANSLAVRISGALDSEEIRHAISQNAKKLMCDNYDWNLIGLLTTEAYKSACKVNTKA